MIITLNRRAFLELSRLGSGLARAGPDLLNGINIGLECCGKNSTINSCGKDSQRHRNCSGICTTKRRNRNSWFVGWVGLIVYQTLWENEHISNLEFLGVKHILGVNKSNIQAAIHKEQELGSSRVGMRRVETACRVLKHSI